MGTIGSSKKRSIRGIFVPLLSRCCDPAPECAPSSTSAYVLARERYPGHGCRILYLFILHYSWYFYSFFVLWGVFVPLIVFELIDSSVVSWKASGRWLKLRRLYSIRRAVVPTVAHLSRRSCHFSLGSGFAVCSENAYNLLMNYHVTGGKKLSGEVTRQYFKNAAVALLCASLLNKGTTTLKRMPRIEELKRLIEVLGSIGVVVVWEENGDIKITPPPKIDLSHINREWLSARARSQCSSRRWYILSGRSIFRRRPVATWASGVSVRTSMRWRSSA